MDLGGLYVIWSHMRNLRHHSAYIPAHNMQYSQKKWESSKSSKSSKSSECCADFNFGSGHLGRGVKKNIYYTSSIPCKVKMGMLGNAEKNTWA